MKYLLIVFLLITHIQVFSQAWMSPPYLNKAEKEATYFDITAAFDQWWGDREYQKGNGFMPFKRWQYINSFRTYPDGQFPAPDQYLNSYHTIILNYELNKNQLEKTDVSNWTPLGLTSWVNGANGYNPGNGRINTVTVDPFNPQIVYVAAPSGGIWKSVNGGQNWNTNFDQMPHLGVSAIAIHPDSSNILFIGTGDRDAGDTKSTGIYKSTNGGNTWDPSGMNTTSWNSINKIIFNPQNSKTMFAAANNGIHRSNDGGQTWTQIYSQTKVTDLVYHPADTTILYGGGKAFVQSVDGGITFTKNTSLPSDTSRIEIAVTPANDDYVYVLASNYASSYGGTYRSVNSGGSFVLMSDTPNYLGYSMDASDNSGQGWYDLAIAASPLDEDEIYIGGINIWKSTNGGNSFDIISHWVYDDPSFYTHADIHYLGFYGNRLYCGSDGGVFYSDDSGTNWTDISEGLGISQIYRLASSPADPDFIVCGTQDNGSNRLQDGTWTHIFGADGMQPMTHRTDVNTFYCSYQFGGLMRTTDNGYTIDFIQPEDTDGDWVTPYDMHPTNSNIIYAGYSDIYKSNNTGYSWINMTNGSLGNDPLHNLKVSPVNPDYIYASRNAYIYVSKDNGQTWTSKYNGLSGKIAGIALSYSDPEKLWIAVSGTGGDRIFFSEDGYQTHQNVTGSLSGTGIRSIVHQKDSHDALFVGTENAVFYKDTTMNDWIPFINGLPNAIISDLEINYTNNKLRAGTYGRGIWETIIPVTQAVDEYTLFTNIIVYPNPSDGILNVNLVEIQNPVTVIIYDITGKLILQQSAVAPQMQIDLQSYVSGIYFIKVLTDRKQYVQRIVLHN